MPEKTRKMGEVIGILGWRRALYARNLPSSEAPLPHHGSQLAELHGAQEMSEQEVAQHAERHEPDEDGNTQPQCIAAFEDRPDCPQCGNKYRPHAETCDNDPRQSR